jgi:hypothetical protein
VLPCCFFGAEVFRSQELLDWAEKDPNYTELTATWAQNPHKVCVRNCATRGQNTAFAQQFREETAF